MARIDLAKEMARLGELTPAELREMWERVTNGPAPNVSPRLLRLALAWELQAKVRGGLSRRTQQRLEQMSQAKTFTREVQPGMRLVREWNGAIHIVQVGEDGVIRWNDKAWRSLSEVVRAITGTRWSGPAFFGLKQKKGKAA
jgi:hypothetical protein